MKNVDLHRVTVDKEKNDGFNSLKESHTADGSEEPSRVLGLMNSQNFARLFYVVSGLILFSSLFVMFNTYFLHLKVETAVVSAIIEPIMSPVGGYVSDVFVASGEQVKKGDPLFKIENIFLEIKLQLARVKMEESKLDIDYYQTLMANESQRLSIYKKIGRNRVVSARSMVGVSKKNVIVAQKTLERFKALHKLNYISHSLMEEKQATYESAQEQLNHALAETNVEKHALNAVNKGMYFTGTKTEGITHDLEAELMSAQKKVALNQRRVRVYETLISRLTLMAPFDGKVTQILKSAGNTADNKSPIIFVEKTSENKKIVAWLTQNEVIHIGKSRIVKIYIPSSGKTYQGRITEINRTDGFIDEVKAQYRWRDFQMDRSAMVSISINTIDQIEFNKHAFSGMPVVVYFSRKFI